MSGKIFISYRRNDSAREAHTIAQYLTNRFGQRRVLLDVDMISGTDFPRALKKWLSKCKVLLVLIGAGWLNAQNEKGGRRIDDPDDWVKLEIESALKRGIAVIPVLIDDTKIPTKAELPDAIAGLLGRQARRIRTEPTESFRNDMAALAQDIAEHLKPPWWIIPAAAAAVLVAIAGVSYWIWASGDAKPTAGTPPVTEIAAAVPPPVLSTADVLSRCVRDQRHPDGAEIVAELAQRFSRGRFRYGWTAETQQPSQDANIVWHKIVEATASDGTLMLRIPWRNGRLRLVPVVKRQFSTRGIANVSLVLQGMWSQDNGYGCVELVFDNNGEARGAIGVMTASTLDTKAYIEQVQGTSY